MENKNHFLRLEDIYKIFGHTIALQGMSLDINQGEIIGLVGPNGAGKSTLMKVITGVYPIEKGRIVFDVEVNTDSYDANQAKRAGIACAYQELSLCSNLSVYENFMVNHLDHKPFGKMGWRKEAMVVSDEYLSEIFPNHGIDVKTKVSDLSLSQRQMVEIARAASYKGLKLLVLDEPTSSLTSNRIIQLHESIKKLADTGVSIIYISHKLDEIDQACDQVVIMKGGSCTWSGHISETSTEQIVELLGGEVKTSSSRGEHVDNKNDTVLEITDLCAGQLKNVNLAVRKGEIVGIAGLAGSGQKALLKEIYSSGFRSKHSAIKLKSEISYVSGDRNNEGVFKLWNIKDNILVSSLKKSVSKGLINRKKYDENAQFWYDKLKFKAEGIDDDITSLSGGNQQKALIARGLANDSDLIIMNDPTCGVDIETKQEIYKLFEEAKEQGKAVILHSTEDLEMEQCDRVYVLHDGEVISELKGAEINVKNLVTASFKEITGNTRSSSSAADENQSGIKDRLLSLLKSRSFLPIFTFLLIMGINIALKPRVLSYNGLTLLLGSAVPLVFIALGQMFLVVSGGIDMGNGMAVGMVNVIVAFTVLNTPGLGVLFLILFIMMYGAMGAMIHLTKIPAIVVTLGASFIWLGLGLIISPTPGGIAPTWLKAIFSFKFPFIPMPLVISALAAFLTFWILKRSKYGMIINGVGSNPAAISRAGWSHLVAMVVIYMVSGLMVVLAGLSVTAVANGGDTNAYANYQMLSIATIILGGCEFKGGISSPVGVVAGALAISSISAMLTFLKINSNLQTAVTGFILIAALAIKLVTKKGEAK
ncbi:MAG: ATP-binding cassette domain-containing protein [Spirochaetales bacterium]|uniref:ATP-binding cassette domain-containing protein n=1 Tax=Candidatus Thalassospirochaeta sargassi TaxID=3119039 RepID=A0AAJ1ICM3_9SPIO|nr:ATP-binding cassette domain-containing protein [Spirochaetales bacterium]